MSSPPVKRKLAAILAADAVGYSRMMGADEEGTMKILAAHRAVIDGIIQFHEGRIVNTAGDSVLAEFASPTQAVRCSVEIQDALKTRNDSLPEHRRLQFRIGVNLGDVMVKGDDLLGDGVNVAARLEGIAEPGNIYVSSSVYDQIAGKLDLGFSDLGEQSLKNIDRPIRAYRVERDKRPVTTPARKPRRAATPWIAAGLIAVALGGGATWYLTQLSATRQLEEAKARAAAENTKAKAEAEIAKARAEAEEARKTAAAAVDSAAAAKRALDEQRAAEARARAQAELAAARADAEATRRKAEAELSAAAEARRAAEAAAKAPAVPKVAAASPARPYEGPWTGAFTCVAYAELPARTFPVMVTFAGGKFEVRTGKPDQPGWLLMNGVPRADGTMQVSGSGISSIQRSYGKPFEAAFDGRFSGERYQGNGRLGGRDCALAMTRGTAEAAAISPAAKVAAATPSRSYQGEWTGTLVCAPLAGESSRTIVATVTVVGDKFELRKGKPDQPGWLLMSGVPQADGTLHLSGTGISGKSKLFETVFDGKLSGGRFEGKGQLGRRDCSLTMARR